MRKNTTSPYITIRRSSIHGRGVFARRDIPKGAKIIEYVGEKISLKESDRRAEIFISRNAKDRTRGAVYIFELNKKQDIDGNVPYNSARYINHSCSPNAESEIVRGRIWIVALREIKAGEEIFYNYGYDFEDFEHHPCFCKTERCVGYIMDERHWPRLRKHLEKQKQG